LEADVDLPLPAAAWRAEVAVDDPPEQIGAGASAELTVHVRNASSVRWPAEGELLVGAHWRTEDGTLVKIGAGRTALPGALEPGASVTLPLSVRAPNSGARRILEVDVFQERTAWFRDRGSTPFQATVELSGGSAEEPTDDPGFEPWIAMYSTPRSEVEGFVGAAGGEVVCALPDHSAGDAFESYMYVVRRTGVPSAHRAVERVSAVLKSMPRGDLLPPLTSNRSGTAARAELWLKGKIARATKWFTIAQLEHDQAVESALTEIEAALLAQEAEIKKLRAELDAERRARSSE
jgi:hypothetical protein